MPTGVSPRGFLTVAAVAAGLAAPAWAQYGGTPEPTPTATATATPTPSPTATKPPAAPLPPQPVTPAFKLPIQALNLAAEVRHRYEYWKDFDFNKDLDDKDDVVGQRIRLSLELVPTDTVKGFIQFQDARAWGNASVYPITGVPVPTVGTGNNTTAAQGASTDLHQAYFSALHKKTGLSIQAGRQEWNYGTQKVIGALNWSNLGRAFDGVRVRHDKKYDTTDVFWARISEGGRTRAGTPVIDRIDADFAGVYSTLKLIKGLPFDVYALMLRDGEVTAGEAGKTGPTKFYTLGFQLSKITGAPGKLQVEYGTELNYQTGDRSGMDHSAYAVHARLGFGDTKWPLQAKLLYQFDLASGDKDRADGKSETFQQLFPTVHLWHGYMDLVARQNVMDNWGALYLVPRKDWKVGLHFHSLKAAEGTDSLYRANGAAIRTPAAGTDGGKDFGNEVNVIVEKKMNANWSLQSGFGQFMTGSYLANVPPAGLAAGAKIPSDDVTYFYFQSAVSF
jgi:hypothetical protein